MRRIDLNVDVGEGFPNDRELLALATSANVCAGAHAGSKELTRETVVIAKSSGLAVGVHPGLPDRGSMGRAPWPIERWDEARRSLEAQVGEMAGDADYVKPHGAFYNQAAEGGPWAELLALLLRGTGLPLFGLPGTFHETAAADAGVRFLAEGFAERGYRDDGRLLPRGEPGAVLEDPELAGRQAVLLAGRVETVCVHGDRPDAVAVLGTVRTCLTEAGFEVARCV